MRAFDLARLKREGDKVMEGGRDTDIVVLVMGPTGAGKSTFLRNVLQNLKFEEAELPLTSDGFESCTRTIDAYIATLPEKLAKHPRQRLVLVDTPGFDDTSVSDSEILRRTGVWLASSFDSRMKVGGVVYMFPIYPNRITRNDKANLKVFQRLCGTDALAKVRMVTTKWSLCPDEKIGESREQQLKSNFWKEMLENGSEISRLDESKASAWTLLTDLLQKSRQHDQLHAIALDLQKEIVQQSRSLPRTEAGRELKIKLQQLLKEHRAASGDVQTRQQKLQNIAAQLRDLKIPFSERIKAFFGL